MYNISRGGQVTPLAHACGRPCLLRRFWADYSIQTGRDSGPAVMPCPIRQLKRSWLA